MVVEHLVLYKSLMWKWALLHVLVIMLCGYIMPLWLSVVWLLHNILLALVSKHN